MAVGLQTWPCDCCPSLQTTLCAFLFSGVTLSMFCKTNQPINHPEPSPPDGRTPSPSGDSLPPRNPGLPSPWWGFAVSRRFHASSPSTLRPHASRDRAELGALSADLSFCAESGCLATDTVAARGPKAMLCVKPWKEPDPGEANIAFPPKKR